MCEWVYLSSYQSVSYCPTPPRPIGSRTLRRENISTMTSTSNKYLRFHGWSSLKSLIDYKPSYLPQTLSLSTISSSQFHSSFPMTSHVIVVCRRVFCHMPTSAYICWCPFSADAPDRKRTACYDIEVDVVRWVCVLLCRNALFLSIFQDSTLKSQLHSFLMSSSSQQDVTTLDTKVFSHYICREWWTYLKKGVRGAN